MVNGVYLSLFVGPVIPIPVSTLIVDALTSVRATIATTVDPYEVGDPPVSARSGFQLDFTLGKKSPLETLFLLGSSAPPMLRVVLAVTINGSTEVIIDGFTQNVQVKPGGGTNPSTMTVLGQDITAAMDLVEFNGLPFPAMPITARVFLLLAKYALLGVIPLVIPPVIEDVPDPTETIFSQQGTDYAYLTTLARECGYVFYSDPGPVPGVSKAYFGPEIKVGVPQPALNVDMDAMTNVESLSFDFDNRRSTMPIAWVRPDAVPIPIPVPIPEVSLTNPPLGLIPPMSFRIESLPDTDHMSFPQAMLFGLARKAASAVPQTFETMEDLVARAEWNAIKPRQTIPQHITEENVGQIDSITVAGIDTRLVPNDQIVFVFEKPQEREKRYVLKVEPNAMFDATQVWLVPTSFSASELVKEMVALLDTFEASLTRLPGTFSFVQAMRNESTAVRQNLVPENGLIKLDSFLDAKIADWKELAKKLTTAEPKLKVATDAMDTAGFLNAVTATNNLKGVVQKFLADQKKLADAIKFLTEAWEGDPASGVNGIKDDISVTVMKSRVTIAIGDANSGIAQVIAAWDPIWKTEAETLLSRLAAIPVPSDDPPGRKSYREAFITAWAEFTDSGLESKFPASGTYSSGKFEGIAATSLSALENLLSAGTPSFEEIANAIRDSVKADGWFRKLRPDAGPLNLRIRYATNPDQKLDVDANGLHKRLEGIDKALTEAAKTLEKMVSNAQGQSLDSFFSTFGQLQSDVRTIGTKIKAISNASSFGKALFEAANECKSLHEAVAEATKQTGDLAGKTDDLLTQRRKIFDDKVIEIVNAFGDPNVWDRNDPKAKNAKELLDKLKTFVPTVLTLEKKAKDPNRESLEPVLEKLAKHSDYEPTNGTPYAPRYLALVTNLDLLFKGVSEFTLLSSAPQQGDRFPDAAGLGDALASLTSSGVSSGTPPDRILGEVVKDNSDSTKTDIPDLFRQIAGSLSPQLRNDLIAIWRQIRSKRKAPTVFALKTIIPLFGHNAPFKSKIQQPPGTVTSEERTWDEIGDDDWRNGKHVYLSQPVEGVTPGSIIVFRRAPGPDVVCAVTSVQSPVQPGVLNVTSAGSFVELSEPDQWHQETATASGSIVLLRKTIALIPSHRLKLVNVPIADPVGDFGVIQQQPQSLVAVSDNRAELELDGLFPDLAAGHHVVVMGDPYMNDDRVTSRREQLYQLLPNVYKVLDDLGAGEEQAGPLRELLSVVCEQVNLLEDDLARWYDNWFIETCEDWTVPYLGDLVGYESAAKELNTEQDPESPLNRAVVFPRREVADTVAFRRRKENGSAGSAR